MIDEETDRLNRLVGEAAEMARLDSGMFKLNRQPHAIRDALDPALEGTRLLLQNHRVEVNIAEGLPPVNMDANLIREVITHLVGKCSEVLARVHISARDSGAQRKSDSRQRGRSGSGNRQL